MSWLDKIPQKIKRAVGAAQRKNLPEGLWSKCESCQSVLYKTDLESNLEVCPKCSHHNRVGARARLNQLLDADSVTPESKLSNIKALDNKTATIKTATVKIAANKTAEIKTNARIEIGANIEPIDPLKFKDSKSYAERMKSAQKEVGEKDALIVMQGSILGLNVVVAAFEFKFMGGSMGSVVGERFVRGIDAAIKLKAPFICVAASGGARMQEGLLSLMQMAKTSAALTKLSQAGLPYISVLTDPTMGGVSASFAMLGDIIIAEPNALIGFAGPRVIEQTVRETLPEGFQRAEFLVEHGAVDLIVDRRELRQKLANILSSLMRVAKVA